LKEQSESVSVDPSKLTELQREMDQTENALKDAQQKHLGIENQLSLATGSKQQITRKIQELQHALSQASARFTALQKPATKTGKQPKLNYLVA